VTSLRLVVPFEPVAKGRPRFVKATGHAYTPPKTAVGEWQIRQAFLNMLDAPEPLTGPLRMSVQCFVRMPASVPQYKRATARPIARPDLDQYVKTAPDALNGHAYHDDAQIVELSACKTYGLPPRWEITLERLDGAML
jgi:Holliday junction resolvase RusA-like endonuclease